MYAKVSIAHRSGARPVLLACSLVAVLVVASAPPAASAVGPGITADRAAVYDPDAGSFLYVRPGDPPEAAMASTAKIMTIHIALGAVADGYVSLSSLVPFSENAVTTACNCFNDSPGTIQTGDRMPLQDALYAVALSDGEPTVAVAEFIAAAVLSETHPDVVADPEAAFVDLMNFEALLMDLEDTHFETPHGGDDVDQVTTAEDLARLWAMAAADHPQFLEILGWWSRGLRVFHGNDVLPTRYAWSNSHTYYPGAEASKGGNSGLCPQCWVASAKRLGRRLVVSNLQSEAGVADAAEQFRWGYAEMFEPARVGDSGDAGLASDYAIDCTRNDVVAAVRTPARQLTLRRFTANADAGTVDKAGGAATTIGIGEVDIARVNPGVVATVERTLEGRVVLRTWRWERMTPVLIDTEAVVEGTNVVRVVRLSGSRILTAMRTASGVRLATWAVTSSGSLVTEDILDADGKVSELDVAVDLLGVEALVAVRRSNGRMLLRSYAITADGKLSLVDASHRGSASRIRVAYVGSGWYGEIGHPDEAYTQRWVTSYVNSTSRLGLAFWRTADGALARAGSWGDAGLPAVETATARAQHTGAVSAYRGIDGRLHLDVADFPWEHPGPASWTHYRMAASRWSAAGLGKHIEVCQVPTSTAAAAHVTGVRTAEGNLKLILWQEALEQ